MRLIHKLIIGAVAVGSLAAAPALAQQNAFEAYSKYCLADPQDFTGLPSRLLSDGYKEVPATRTGDRTFSWERDGRGWAITIMPPEISTGASPLHYQGCGVNGPDPDSKAWEDMLQWTRGIAFTPRDNGGREFLGTGLPGPPRTLADSSDATFLATLRSTGAWYVGYRQDADRTVTFSLTAFKEAR